MGKLDSLLKRLKETSDDEAALDLLREFDSGAPVERLRELLADAQGNGLRAGVWIASELGARVRPLLKEIEPLLTHDDRYVRFFALDCALQAAQEHDGRVLASAAALVRDPDDAVRWKAMMFLASASEAQLDAARRESRDSVVKEELSWLLVVPLLGASQVRANLRSEDVSERLLGAIAAARLAELDPAPLLEAREFDDESIRRFSADWLDRIES
jgi:hypothetical protein